MRTVLVNPPSGFLIDDKVFPPLGILRVAEAVDAEVIDLAGLDGAFWVAALMRARGADVIGIGATTPQMPMVAKIARALRDIAPAAALVIGGAHPTMCFTGSERAQPARQWLLEHFDVVVAGDGEEAIQRAVHGERGLVRADRRKDAGFLKTGDVPTGRRRIDLASYRYTIDGLAATSLVSQLGCPFNCGFCGGRNSEAYRLVRRRGVQSVVAELEEIHRAYGYRAFMFMDDELNVNRQMIPLMDAIAGLQERLGVDFRLRGFVKAELFTDAQAAAMRRAGFAWVMSGFEAADDRILRNIRKVATSEDNTRVIEIAARHGLKVKCLMSIGHPGESEASVRAVEDWLIEVEPAEFDVSLISLYPGSPYFDGSVRNGKHWTYAINGDVLHSADMDFTRDHPVYKGIPGEYQSYVWTDHLSREDLAGLRDDLERTVRARLGHSSPQPRVAQIEHSMGITA